MKKRVLSLLMSAVLCLSALPTAAFAEDADVTVSGGAAGGESGVTIGGNGSTDGDSGVTIGGNGSIGGDGGESGGDSGAGGGIYNPGGSTGGGGIYTPGEDTDEDTRTVIWFDTSRHMKLQRDYNGRTDVDDIHASFIFTDGSNEIMITEGKDCEAVKTFDSPDVGERTVHVKLTLIGEAAEKYKLREGEDEFTIGGTITKAYTEPTLSLTRSVCTTEERIRPLLLIDDVKEEAEVTYYCTAYKSIIGYTDYEDSEYIPKVDESTILTEPGTYYLYAKSTETKSYRAGMSNVVELTVNDPSRQSHNICGSVICSHDGHETASFSEYDGTGEINYADGSAYIYLADNLSANLTVADGQKLFLCLSGKSLAGGVNVGAGGELTLCDCVGNGTISAISVDGGALEVFGGKVGALTLSSDSTLQLYGGGFGSVAGNDINAGAMLPKGYAFRNADGSYVRADADSLEDVTIEVCQHVLTADFNDGVCPYCGKELAATVTKEVSGSTETKGFTELKEALAIAYGGTVKLMNDVDAGKGVKLWNDVTLDLNGKKVSSSETYVDVLDIASTATVKNGTVIASGNGAIAIRTEYRSDLTLEDLTVKCAGSGVAIQAAYGRVTIKSGTYDGLAVNGKVVLEGGTFYPCKALDGKELFSIAWQFDPSNIDTSNDCMQLLGEGCGYIDANGEPLRTFGGIYETVTVKRGAIAPDTPVARIGDTNYPSLREAIAAADDNDTIVLVDDLNLDSGSVLITDDGSFTIDLDGHTLTTNQGYLVYITASGANITLKNGTLDGSRTTSYYGAVSVSGNNSKTSVTLDGVTVISAAPSPGAFGSMIEHSAVCIFDGTVRFTGNGSCTGGVTIDGGNAILESGTFEKGENSFSVRTKTAGMHLSDYLAEGSLFWNGDAPLDLSGTAEISDTVSVRECEHDWEDGVCTICRKVCGHAEEDGSMASADCSICGLKDVAVAEVNTSPVKYFADLDKAIECAGNAAGTVKLRKSVSSGVVTIEKAIILDLNGCYISELLVKAEAKLMNSGASNGKIGKLTISSDIALTLGDLPEEGYGFKYDNGNWMNNGWGKEASSVSVLEAPITRVWLNAENADYEQVPTTMTYGTTGSVTLNPGCVQPNGADIAKGVLWEIKGGTIEQVPERFPYTLPADLHAGEHTYRVIFTSEGYSKSADITIVVKPVELSAGMVTVTDLIYNGTEQTPTVTVKNGETVLKNGTDYTLSGDLSATDAGSYKLIVTGDGNNFVGTVEKTWKLAPMKLNYISVESISKTYDGTAKVVLPKSKLTFFDENYNPTTIPDDVYEITDARFMRRLEDNKTYENSPEAGGGKTIVFTVTLTSDNYVLVEHEYNNGIRTEIEKKSAEYYFATSDENAFRINQADVPEEAVGELTITNGLAETYSLKLSDLLPELDSPRDYGTVEYGRPETNLGVGSFVTEVNSKTDALTLKVVNRSGTDEGRFGTIRIPVTTENYKPFTLTINVSAVNKLFPLVDGTVSATGLTYGQKLGESVIFGEMKDPDTGATVYGRFVWLTDGETKLAVGSYTFDWKFIPDASDKYAPVTGKTAVNVVPRAVIISGITAGDKIYDGKTDAVLDLSGVKLDGVLEGDELTITATGIFRSKDADDNKAGVVDLSDLVFGGKSADSYVIDATNSQRTASAFIRRAELTVTPDTLSKTYGVSDPELTFSVAGAVGDEQPAFTGALGRAAGEDVGTYAVTSGTLKLKDNGGFRAGNYKLVFSADTVNFTINRASRADETVAVEAKHKTSGRVDLSGYIVPGGALTFKVTDDINSILKGAPTLDGGVMSFALTENIGRARVDFTVTSTNYTDYHIIVAISSTEKDAQAVLTVVGADRVTYKNMLTLNVSGGSGTGAVTYTVENATGEATISGNVLTATRAGTVIVIATKAGDDNYNAVTSAPFVITITKAVPTGEPEYTPITSGGMTLADARLTTEGGTFSVSGTVIWVDENGVGLDEDTIVRANTAYKWEFTPADTVNYTAISGSITLYHAYEGGGIYISRHTIRAIAGANGSISPSGNVSVTEGRDRTFTITPDDGYAISDVRVDGRSVGAVESYTFQSVRTAHTIEADFVKVEEPAMNIFEDVPEDSYYAEAVYWAIANGVTNGVDSTHFSPDSVCTRAQAVTFLWRAAGCPKPESTDMPFTDVPVGSYYYDAVLWAVENGIANGTGGSEFAPDATCTRAHIVTFLWRSESSPAVEGDETFIDVPSDAYYYDAVLWAVSEKVTNGTGNDTFSPDADCTRAQIVTFLWRLWN